MSIINQALKKAQRERQQAQGGVAWVLPGSREAGPSGRRGQTVWIAAAALFALSLGATLHAWLGNPTARIETAHPSVRPVTAATLPSAAEPPTRTAQADVATARQIVNPVPRRLPDHATPGGIVAAAAARVIATRRPAPPATAADYTARGNTLYRRGDYRRALEMYEAALALDPLDVKARNNLGSTYMQLTMDDRAIAAFREALRLDNSYSLAHYNLACVHARDGNVESAAAYLRQAVAIEPEARDWASTDADFASVRNAPEFRQLLEP